MDTKRIKITDRLKELEQVSTRALQEGLDLVKLLNDGHEYVTEDGKPWLPDNVTHMEKYR